MRSVMAQHAFVPAVMEHIELAGVHSGDSACIIPSVHIQRRNVETIKEYTRKIAEEMHVKWSDEYAVCNRERQGICTGGKSESIPYRTIGIQGMWQYLMVTIATDIMTSELTGKPSPLPEMKEVKPKYYGVKEAVFPFNMFQEVDPVCRT